MAESSSSTSMSSDTASSSVSTTSSSDTSSSVSTTTTSSVSTTSEPPSTTSEPPSTTSSQPPSTSDTTTTSSPPTTSDSSSISTTSSQPPSSISTTTSSEAPSSVSSVGVETTTTRTTEADHHTKTSKSNVPTTSHTPTWTSTTSKQLLTTTDAGGSTVVVTSDVIVSNLATNGARQGSSSNAGAIAGGVVGGLAALIIVGVLFWMFKRRRRRELAFDPDMFIPKAEGQNFRLSIDDDDPDADPYAAQSTGFYGAQAQITPYPMPFTSAQTSSTGSTVHPGGARTAEHAYQPVSSSGTGWDAVQAKREEAGLQPLASGFDNPYSPPSAYNARQAAAVGASYRSPTTGSSTSSVAPYGQVSPMAQVGGSHLQIHTPADTPSSQIAAQKAAEAGNTRHSYNDFTSAISPKDHGLPPLIPINSNSPSSSRRSSLIDEAAWGAKAKHKEREAFSGSNRNSYGSATSLNRRSLAASGMYSTPTGGSTSSLGRTASNPPVSPEVNVDDHHVFQHRDMMVDPRGRDILDEVPPNYDSIPKKK